MRDYYESGESESDDEPPPIRRDKETKDNLTYYICRFQHDIFHLAHSCAMYVFAYPN